MSQPATVGRPPIDPTSESTIHLRSVALDLATRIGLTLNEWERICQHIGPVYHVSGPLAYWTAVADYIGTLGRFFTEKEMPARTRITLSALELYDLASRIPAPGNQSPRY